MEEQLSNRDLFETMPVPRAVAKMCLPGIFSTIVNTLYTLADTYFVAMLNDPIQTAAIAIAASALYINMAISSWFGTGGSSYMSREMGKGNIAMVRKVTVSVIWRSVIIGGLVSVLYGVMQNPVIRILGSDAGNAGAVSQYLFWTLLCGAIPSILNVVMANLVTAEGFATFASIGTISGCILNMILDPFFVLPRFLGMGAAGAGLATFLSNCVAVLYFVVLIGMRRGKTNIVLNPAKFRPDMEILKNVSTIGIPAALQAFTYIVNSTVRNNILGAYGSVVISAYGISYRIAMVPTTISLGTALGILPLLGYNYSQRNKKRMQEILGFVMKIGLLFSVLVAVLLFAFPDKLMYLFMKDPEVIRIGAKYLRIAFPTVVVMFISGIIVAVFQACGKGKNVLAIVLARKFALEIPCMFLLDHIFSMYGMAFGEPIAETVIIIFGSIAIKRLFDSFGKQ